MERWSAESERPEVELKKGIPESYNVAHTNTLDWCPEARLWWHSYELTAEHALRYNIRSIGKWLFLTGGTVAMQIRSFNGSGPKYITHKLDSSMPLLYLTTDDPNTLLIVEDLVSAYKLNIAGFDVMCLMGTSMTEPERRFAAMYDRVWVWLDDDTAGIVGAAKIVKELSPFCAVKAMILAQPKEISFTDLASIRESL